ncbi:MAG: hypothetical protein JRJ84_15315 [Deltaproteobacteria bacterium]|nr:hypothetical protein [Deltaproteobacteria bacterium]
MVIARELRHDDGPSVSEWDLGGTRVAFADQPRALTPEGSPRLDVLAFRLFQPENLDTFRPGQVAGLLPPEDSDVRVAPDLVWDLVEHAASELESRPGSPSAHELARELRQLVEAARTGEADARTHLLVHFLPTSSWDDEGGSQPIANSILRGLKCLSQ